ncbi:MAG: hypothetical protein P9X24_00220 [Candidatus Hatepunaea meridiana]|nr:hypothetical protein [Candidatus Hatepunaea meridiana]
MTTNYFDDLVKNGIDYLNQSIDQIDVEPKYSVINFYTSIEILLKARLLLEHWTLIIERPEDADIKNFIAGDFVSISLKSIRRRLKNIIDVEIPERGYTCFNSLRAERNKLIHFFNPLFKEDEAEGKSKRIERIKEILRSWFWLHRLLTQKWHFEFKDYQEAFSSIDDKMKKLKHYLGFSYEQLEPEIKKKKATGSVFVNCDSCNYLAAEETELNNPIVEQKCLVCNYFDEKIRIECSVCGVTNYYYELVDVKCIKCNSIISVEDVIKEIEHVQDPHDPDSWEPFAWCSQCITSVPTVIPSNKEDGFDAEYWICIVCLEHYGETSHCGRCGSHVVDDSECSVVNGCSQCNV